MVHFVLVHGACHGAWSWHKVKALLESEGHRVTAIDLAASGINMRKIDEVRTIADYTQPLMEFMASLPSGGEKVTLVGHSLGGLNLALAMESFPHKISASVFLTAFMPDSTHPPSYVFDQFSKRISAEYWSDTQFSSVLDPLKPTTTMFFGPKFLASKLYQLCPSQDLALAMLLIRPGSLFLEDLSKGKAFSEVGFGSVNRIYIVCKKDLGITVEFQRWMIENNPVKEVMEVEDAGHMPMLSKPNELCCCLLEIGQKYT
ncbi:salicylic acid-binding protein 2-like [Telopea speciosissima]|uniref:salicylic acid-binding protein 2-like n=1 Tax=Telopea speciosissima TaxID=54955 RepID=UPI001CC3F751|nr:salicylic acid-binding protein 2-like [Telopea speciosissima]XP_043712796.1 salicylic acid-binding protein 2-like [Telopea speciosissima]